MNASALLIVALGVYAVLGLVFSIVFLTRGVHQIDEAVRDSPRAIRLLLIPGTVALWPMLWHRWRAVGLHKKRRDD